ncbi:ATP-binding protein [Sphingomonas sp. CARO-RG-8B-R24-01]|uniref:ATP-binding protein n=1 Tax=Sphingomonas sp. CARO-RG-8B-R24-01 TaxID=2914831 RepID=UPI001F58B0B0|nr:ATP-binding protein [Sphingomonas sp. CARO-RG-8B-R24-01]
MRRRAVRRVRHRIGHALRSRALAAKLVVILTGVGLVGAVALIAVLASVIVPSFNDLEARSTQVEVERTRSALETIARQVELKARDYAEDTARRPTPAHTQRLLGERQVDGVSWIDGQADRDTVHWRAADGKALEQAFAKALPRAAIDRAIGSARSAHFYVKMGDVLAAVGVVRVAGMREDDPPRFFALASRLSGPMVSEASHLPVRLDPAGTSGRVRMDSTRTTLRIAVPIRGIDGRPVASAVINVRRDFSVLGQRVLLLAVAGSIILLLLVLLALRRMITTLVLRPLARVERHMQAVQSSGALDLLSDTPRDDEIGSLVASFNGMLRQQHDLRQQLEIQNFALGKSESAIAMLHNVRNALTPVSTILSRAIVLTAPVDQTLVERAVAELATADIAPDRRSKLSAFVAAAVAAETADRSERQRELQVARDAMAHVLEIIGQQQRAVHERPEVEACDVTEILARNATIARYAGSVSIAVSFPAQPCLVLANRVILSQVIGNLFANAADAIAAHGTGSGSIIVTIERAGDMARIAIRDDGEGFVVGAAPSLFQRGFSTRRHKVGGLGLHWCANAMLAMQGQLRLDSAGPEQGAVATLTLHLAT